MRKVLILNTGIGENFTTNWELYFNDSLSQVIIHDNSTGERPSFDNRHCICKLYSNYIYGKKSIGYDPDLIRRRRSDCSRSLFYERGTGHPQHQGYYYLRFIGCYIFWCRHQADSKHPGQGSLGYSVTGAFRKHTSAHRPVRRMATCV